MRTPFQRWSGRISRQRLGLAVAGLVVVAGAVGGLAAYANAHGESYPTTVVRRLGRPADVTAGDGTGTATVTVLSAAVQTPPVAAPGPAQSAVPATSAGATAGPSVGGRTLLVVSAEVCNVAGQPLRRIDEFFRLRLSSGAETAELVRRRVDARPDLSAERGGPSTRCLSGELTFVVPPGTHGTKVLYQPSGSYTYAWPLPRT